MVLNRDDTNNTPINKVEVTDLLKCNDSKGFKATCSQVVTTDCHGLMAGKLMNPVTTTECYNQVTGLMPDFSTASSTCESYSSAESADQVVVGWSCSDAAKGLVYSWGGGDHGTMSCNSEKHFLCVTTPGSPDLPVDDKCPSAAHGVGGHGPRDMSPGWPRRLHQSSKIQEGSMPRPSRNHYNA